MVYCMVMENIRDWFDLGRKSVVLVRETGHAPDIYMRI